MRSHTALLTVAALVVAGTVTGSTIGPPGPASAQAAADAAAGSTVPVTVSVEAGRVLHRIDPHIYGVHFPAWNETAYVNGELDPRLAQDLATARFRTLAFPGGGYGYHYTWNDPNLPTELTTRQFLHVAQRYDATPRITVNLNGTPQLAASWVRYAKKQHGQVRYWEIGDEPYLYMNADAFVAKVRAFVPAMKRADPSTKIMLNVSPLNETFSKQVIEQVGGLADVWSIHFFPMPPSQKFNPGSPYSADDKQAFYDDLLATPASFAEQLANVKQWVRAVHPHRHYEYDLGGWAPVTYAPEDWTVNALPDGLWAADMFGVAATVDLDSAAAWALMNPYPPGNGDFGYFSPAMKPYVIARAEQLYAQHFGSLLVRANADVDELSTYASLSRDHRTLYVVMVNKDPDRALDATLDVHGFRPRGQAAAWVLDGPTTTERLEGYGLRRELLDGDQLTVPAYSAVAVELPARGRAGAAPNLAEDKYATASSSAFATDPVAGQQAYQFLPRSGVDGLNDTRWAADYFEEKPAWFQVDLGQAQPFDRVRLRWDYPAAEYQVQISDDGETWRTVADQSDATTLHPAPQPVEEVRFPEVTARYVRLSMTGRPDAEGAAAGASQWTPEAFSLWELGVYLGR